MYGWIWRRLPGSATAKALQAVLLVGLVVGLLLFVVFPAIDPLLPFNEVTTR